MAEKGYECILKLGGDTIGKAQDVGVSFETEQQDITTRDDGDWTNDQHGHKTLVADVTALWVPTDTGIKAIEDAYFNDTSLAFEITDADGYGWQGSAGVYDLTSPQNLGDAVTFDFTLRSRSQVSQMPLGS